MIMVHGDDKVKPEWLLYLVISMYLDHDSNGACGEAIACEMKYKIPIKKKIMKLPCHLHAP